MPVKKLKLEDLIAKLVKRIIEIDNDPKLSRSNKTSRIASAAKSFKTSIYTDKRRHEEQRIMLSTYHKYLTKARSRITEQGWIHHSFEQTVDKLIKKYNCYEKELASLKNLPLVATRLRNKEIIDSLSDVSSIRIDLNSINFDDRNKKSKLNKLSKKYPFFADLIIQIDNSKPVIVHEYFNKLINKLNIGEVLYTELSKLKIDHEVMRHLKKDDIHADKYIKQNQEQLEVKKVSTIDIDHQVLMNGIYNLLTVPTVHLSDSTGWAYSRLALGIAFCTGRRAIEVVTQGRFKKKNKNTIEFSGQAKRRTGVNYHEKFEIYTLIDSDILLKAIEELRNTSKVLEMSAITTSKDHYSANDRINNRIASPLNQQMKQFMDEIGMFTGRANRGWYFKDTRAIYAAITFKLFFESDVRWKDKDPDSFFSEILAHDDKESQSAYKQFKIKNLAENWKPVIEKSTKKTRLNELKALDKLESIKHGKALNKIHEWVKIQVEKNPLVKITQSMIVREVGSNRPAAKQYVSVIAADALSIVELSAISNSVAEKKGIVKKVSKETTEKHEEKSKLPKFTIPKKLTDGSWDVSFTHNGNTFKENIVADSSRIAMAKCWEKYQKQNIVWPEPSDIDIKASRKDGMWHAKATINKRTFEVHQRGRANDAVEALRYEYKEFLKSI